MGSIAMEMSMEPPGSDSSASPDESGPVQGQAPKRTADAAGLKPGMRPAKSVKRRASKACQCCRSRKVRCNVVEHGAPCTNCRLDEVECIVSESKRKKYVLKRDSMVAWLITHQEMDDERNWRVAGAKQQHDQSQWRSAANVCASAL